jgi:hypothetical protein
VTNDECIRGRDGADARLTQDHHDGACVRRDVDRHEAVEIAALDTAAQDSANNDIQ